MPQPSGYPPNVEKEITDWMASMFRTHAGRFLQASPVAAKWFLNIMLTHRVYRTLEQNPGLMAAAVERLKTEFGAATVDDFLQKMENVKHY